MLRARLTELKRRLVPDPHTAEVYTEPYDEWRQREDYLYRPSPAVFVAGILGGVITLLAVFGVVQAWKWIVR